MKRVHFLALLLFCWSIAASRVAASPRAYFYFSAPLHGASFTTSTSGDYYEALIFTVFSPDADLVSVDMSSPGNGVFGRFVQRWQSSNADGNYDIKTSIATAKNLSPSDCNFDSHLLSDRLDIAYFTTASESLGSGGIAPVLGEQLVPFSQNSLSVGYGVSGSDG